MWPEQLFVFLIEVHNIKIHRQLIEPLDERL